MPIFDHRTGLRFHFTDKFKLINNDQACEFITHDWAKIKVLGFEGNLLFRVNLLKNDIQLIFSDSYWLSLKTGKVSTPNGEIIGLAKGINVGNFCKIQTTGNSVWTGFPPGAMVKILDNLN